MGQGDIANLERDRVDINHVCTGRYSILNSNGIECADIELTFNKGHMFGIFEHIGAKVSAGGR